jgi:hypothetical protein
VWVNGVDDGAGPSVTAVPASAFNLVLGNRSEGVGGDTYAFIGTIDAVRIYARAKTAAEICAAAERNWNGSSCL